MTFNEKINQEIGELSPQVFKDLLDAKREDQFLNFEWCVICTTGDECCALGFKNKEDTIDHLKDYYINEERDNWFLYKCFHHKKEVKIEVFVTLKES